MWTSVFALFVVTVFWGFVNDCFDNAQGRRLFAFIAVGASLGGIVGSSLTAGIAELVPTFGLLLVACAPLDAASWCVKPMNRWFGGGISAAAVGRSATAARPRGRVGRRWGWARRGSGTARRRPRPTTPPGWTGRWRGRP